MFPLLKRYIQLWHHELIRPLVHRSFTRLIWGLFLSLMLAFLVTQAGGTDLRSTFLLLYGILCLLGAWLSHLQLDGVKLPRLDKIRTRIDRKRPKRQTGDMIDFIDEEMEEYEDLDDEERYLVLLCADGLCGILFVLFSLIV